MPVFEQAFKNIDDVLRKEAGCTTELDYTEQTSWLLFLKYLDSLEDEKKLEAELGGKKYSYILDRQYRWDNWAAPKGRDRRIDHNKAMVGDDTIVPDPTKLINKATRARLKNYLLNEGDIVVARRGEIGRCAVVGSQEKAGSVEQAVSS